MSIFGVRLFDQTIYELRCNECGKSFGNRPQSACDDCLAPLEVHYDLESVRGRFTRESVAAGPANIWRYKELLPIPAGFEPDLPGRLHAAGAREAPR